MSIVITSSYPSYIIILVKTAGRIVLTAVKTMLCEYWIIKHWIWPVLKNPSSWCSEQCFSYKSDFLRLWLKNKRKGNDKNTFAKNYYSRTEENFKIWFTTYPISHIPYKTPPVTKAQTIQNKTLFTNSIRLSPDVLSPRFITLDSFANCTFTLTENRMRFCLFYSITHVLEKKTSVCYFLTTD